MGKKLFEGNLNTFIIMLSLVPLMFVTNFFYFNIFIIIYFIAEFIYKINRGDYKRVEKAVDIITLISYLPFLSIIRLVKLIRILKIVMKDKYIKILINLFVVNKEIFLAITQLSLLYMVITSLIVFNVEPQTFNNNYFYAFYWSGITLTTVGYGDIYPVTQAGQFIALISSFIGIGIIALPTGVLGSSLIQEFKKSK